VLPKSKSQTAGPARRRRAWGVACLSAALLAWHLPALAQLGFSGTVTAAHIAELSKRFGPAAPMRIADWQKTLRALRPAPGTERTRETDLLGAVNDYFNRNMAFVDDLRHWGVEDDWATPADFVGSGGGDCEDYVLAKYYALKELGVPVTRLRITYVRSTRIRQPHMVLGYYATRDADPLVLDNLEPRMLPASQRRDLTPVYGVNDDELWLERGGTSAYQGSAGRVRLWRELQDKLRRQHAE